MNCSCIFIADYEKSEFHNSKIVKARKIHICIECGEKIINDIQYEYTVGLWNEKFYTYKTCLDCLSIRNSFFCDRWGYGVIFEDLWEHLFYNTKVSSKCMMGLTKTARDKVCDMIEEIWNVKDYGLAI